MQSQLRGINVQSRSSIRFACRRYGGVAENYLSFTAGFVAGIAHVYRLIIVSIHRVDPCMIYWVTAFWNLSLSALVLSCKRAYLVCSHGYRTSHLRSDEGWMWT